MKTDRSSNLFQQAQQIMPGGVSSPVRAFRGVGGDPLFIAQADGAYVTDVDGNRYVDYVLSWGPLILGHAHPAVVEAVQQQAARGTSYGAPTEMEIQLAEMVTDLMPAVEMVRFVNSGTEATMSALRLARAYTDRNKIVKFQGCYHGHADMLLVQAGSGVATLGLPDSPGVPPGATQDTLTAPFNDLDAVKALFEQFPDDIAAVIVEPVGGNMSVVPPVDDFLQGLRELCTQHDALLVFDEVMTGFRVALGGAQALYGVEPDMTAFGKVIGGGLPVGAYGGRKSIMEQVAPAGTMYQAGTLSGNPLAMAAGLATLRTLQEPGVFDRIVQVATTVRETIDAQAAKAGIPMQTTQVGTMFGMFFNQHTPTNYDEVAASDAQRYGTFFHKLLQNGVYFAPSAFESAFAGLPHEGDALAHTIDALERVFPQL